MDVLKEEMNSFDITVVTVELDRILSGFHINKIYQLNPKTLLLKIRGREAHQSNLILEAGKRVHATSYVFKTPLKPPDFCMALRKYLRNGRIERVRQHGFERIVEITVTSRGKEFRLIIELFGEGNIILLDPEDKILHALRYRRMRDRNVVRGEIFAYPPSRGEDPRTLRREALYEIRNFGRLEVVRAAARFLSIGGSYAEELLLRAGVAKNTPCSSLKDKDLDNVFNGLQELLSEATIENEKPCVFVDEDGRWVDVAPLQLRQYAHLKHERFANFNEALDEYYAKVLVGEKATDVGELVEREVTRLERMLRGQAKTLRESKKKAAVYRKIGDAIYLHLSELQLLTQRIMEDKRGGKSWKEITKALEKERSESRVPAVYFESLKPRSLSVQVSVEGQTFSLNLKSLAQKNAAEYYVMAKKAERKIAGAERALEKTRETIEKTRVQRIEKVETASKTLPKRRKREWYEKFRWFRSSDGFLVIGGRDASTNEVLIKKHVEPQDIVFHAEISGAPFAVVKTEGRTPPEQTIKETAQFAASYSRGWKEGLGAIDVYWVSPKQVSKTPPSGEYLPKGSFMIYGTKNYVRGAPLEVAVG
ncbi:MAG: ribosome rescue protein RqcH, partial [Candidatus Bathyarchaeota archaeon]|nr:ribosome rescue protein RqcH [Candidatus Bathyarchaeota archaeon]